MLTVLEATCKHIPNVVDSSLILFLSKYCCLLFVFLFYVNILGCWMSLFLCKYWCSCCLSLLLWKNYWLLVGWYFFFIRVGFRKSCGWLLAWSVVFNSFWHSPYHFYIFRYLISYCFRIDLSWTIMSIQYVPESRECNINSLFSRLKKLWKCYGYWLNAHLYSHQHGPV